LGIGSGGNVYLYFPNIFEEGYSHVWEVIKEKENLDVVLKFTVTSVNRTPDHVNVSGYFNDRQGDIITEEFDYLVSTLPPPENLKIIENVSDIEYDIFSRLIPHQLVSTLYESSKQVRSTQVFEYHPDLLTTEYAGRVYAQRNSHRCYFGTGTNALKKDINVAYQFLERGEDKERQELLEIFYRDMRQREIEDVKVIKQVKWPYFYRFGPKDILQKYPWKLLEIQGKNRTIYTGGSAFFESVQDILNYNSMVLHGLLGKKNILVN